MMKAIIRERYGSLDVLELKEIEIPIPSEREVLVKVNCTTVNRSDCSILTGKPFVIRFFTGLFRPRNKVTGTDFAGDVVAIGKAVTKFKIGDRVMGLDDEGLSSRSEFMIIDESKAITKIPDHVNYHDAVASLEGGHYALNFLNKVKVKKGDKILVNGATGAIGSAAIQLLLLEGAQMTAVCDTKNYDLIKSMGVHRVIDYKKEDFTQDKEKYHFVLDAVGKSRFKKCKPILLNDGIYVSSELGPFAENVFLAMKSKFTKGKSVKFPIPDKCLPSVLHLSDLLKEEKFKPIIDRIYPMEDIKEALKYVQTGMKTGNVILQIAE